MSSLYVATTVLSVVIVYLYTYFKRKHSFWKDKGVPTPRVLPIVGHALDLTLAPFHDVMARNTKECGKTYGTYQVTRPILMTSDPEIIKNVTIRDSHIFINHQDFSDVFGEVGKRFLLNLRDDEWRRMRNIMSPAFTSGKMKGMFPVIRNCAKNSLVALEDYVAEDVDLRKFF
ncbi:Cytochrome P450 3A11 [Halotydeus destructor]|nr:Cytochrome P450 3A11 [Halotydeus destructor]